MHGTNNIGAYYAVAWKPKNQKTIAKSLNQDVDIKNLMRECAKIVLIECNKYIPKDSGNLRRNGYTININKSTKNPWVMITYHNTKDMPYVMYQYYGKIWRNNYAVLEAEPFNPNNLKRRQVWLRHTGEWRSSAHKVPTNKSFHKHPTTFTLYKKVYIPGKAAKDITPKRFNWRKQMEGRYQKVPYARGVIRGYKYAGSKPKWVEIVDKQKDTNSGYMAKIIKLVTELYGKSVFRKKI